jgi:hypothetical protein
MPIVPYLAGKILSEVTALLLVATSIWALTLSVETDRYGVAYFVVLSGMLLSLAALARLDIVLSFIGFFVAAVLIKHTNSQRTRLIKLGFIILALSAVGYVATIYLLGAELRALIIYFDEFTGAANRPTEMSLLGIVTFGGVIYCFSLIGLFHPDRKRKLFLVVWFLLAAGSSVALTCGYMVEPRYLVHGLIPFAGLGALGIDVIYQRIERLSTNEVIVSMSVVSILLINTLILDLMPYELDRREILQAVHQIQELDGEAAILIPWTYTDFNFLFLVKPDSPIYNVNFPNKKWDSSPSTIAWKDRLEGWYGEAYVDSPVKLRQITMKRPVYYLGWRKYPPAENAKKMLEFFGFKFLSNLVENLPLRDHLTESWVWYFPEYSFQPVGRCGQYEYYRLTKRTGE